MSKIVQGRSLPIKDISVNNRRREDMGDLQGLAASLNQYGLLHPIVVDDEWNLVAGGRRLAAATLLGWDSIEVRFATELTDKEKQALELEENIRRKDLTEYEKSKKLVELVEIVKEQAKDELRTDFVQNNKTPVGRPHVPGSTRDIASRVGIPPATIADAKKHIQAIEKHPELKDLPKSTAIKKAKELDNQQEPKSQPKTKVVKNDTPQPEKPVNIKPLPDFTEQQLKDALRMESVYREVDSLYCEMFRRKDEMIRAWAMYWRKYGRMEHCLGFSERLTGLLEMFSETLKPTIEELKTEFEKEMAEYNASCSS